MLPVIALIGRPNVGKSTLFNWLTKSRDALVADTPGVTRDRLYGRGLIGDRPYFVVDTGGIVEQDKDHLAELTEFQVQQAIADADLVFFVVDAIAGCTPADELIAEQLRPFANKVRVIVNKTDHRDPLVVTSDFYRLGFTDPVSISARRGQGVKELMFAMLAQFPIEEQIEEPEERIKIAIVGRPNVGKSTLTNRMLGEERVIVLDKPGTTRDSIYIPYDRRGKQYLLIDTAGMRRRARVEEEIEKLSFLKALQAMEKAQVVILVLNAREGILDQDLRLLGMILNLGKGLVLVFNQWDGLSEEDKNKVKQQIDRRLPFVSFARRYFISALHGSGVGMIYQAIHEAYACACKQLTTSQLTQALERAIKAHQPPLVKGRRVRPRFAHLGGHHPMVIIVHGKQMNELPMSYKRYLMNFFRDHFKLIGIPLMVHFKNDLNPYVKEEK